MKDVGNYIKIDSTMNKRIEEIKKELTQDRKFIQEITRLDIKLTEEKFTNSLVNLLLYKDQSSLCISCTSLEMCKQTNIGFKPLLIDEQSYIHLQYKPCEYKVANDIKRNVEANLKSFFMPKKVMHASMDQVDLEEGRVLAVTKIASFAKTYTKGKFLKGVFLHGPFGVGKTYLLSAMANALVKRGIKVAFVYLPDMIRELKSAIGNNSLEKLVYEIKHVDVLILDDIGSEMNTQWVRDEIIGPLLQFRMLEELPTFFTSNKSIDELINDYAITTDHVKDVTKAKRIGDRIRALADEYILTGKNYRY